MSMDMVHHPKQNSGQAFKVARWVPNMLPMLSLEVLQCRNSRTLATILSSMGQCHLLRVRFINNIPHQIHSNRAPHSRRILTNLLPMELTTTIHLNSNMDLKAIKLRIINIPNLIHHNRMGHQLTIKMDHSILPHPSQLLPFSPKIMVTIKVTTAEVHQYLIKAMARQIMGNGLVHRQRRLLPMGYNNSKVKCNQTLAIIVSSEGPNHNNLSKVRVECGLSKGKVEWDLSSLSKVQVGGHHRIHR